MKRVDPKNDAKMLLASSDGVINYPRFYSN